MILCSISHLFGHDDGIPGISPGLYEHDSVLAADYTQQVRKVWKFFNAKAFVDSAGRNYDVTRDCRHNSRQREENTSNKVEEKNG